MGSMKGLELMLHPLNKLSVEVLDDGQGGEQQKNQPTRSPEGWCGATKSLTPLIAPASGKENSSLRRQSEDVGASCGFTTSAHSLV